MKELEKNITNLYGDKGKQFLADLPDLVMQVEAKYGLSDLKPVKNLSYNYVLSGLQGKQPIILKLGLDSVGFKREAVALKAFAGFGVVKVLVESNGMLLLERAISGVSLRTYFTVKESDAIHITCECLKRLHQASLPTPNIFPHIKDWLMVLDRDLPIPAHYLHKARKLRDDLLETSAAPVLLHGDLHHDNILQSGDDWIVIDPKGVIGESAYEVAAFIRNPIPELLALDNAPNIISYRITHFAEILKLPAPRILDWCFVQAVLAWAWALEDGDDGSNFKHLTEVFDKKITMPKEDDLKAVTLFHSIKYFETDRMIAKRITGGDFEDFLHMHQDEQAMATLGGVRSVEETRENLKWNLKQWENNGFGLWLFRSKATGQLIGRGGIRRVPIGDVEEVELGFALMPEYWGRGLATEMAKACSELAFEKLKLDSIVSFTLKTNVSSQHVIEKTGFKYERDIELGGDLHVLYRLSADDYCQGHNANYPHIIGISGKTGAGKSTLAKILSSDLNATLISWDDFDDISLEPEDFVGWYNRGGNYSEFQREGLEKVLAKLKEGKNIIHPVLQNELTPTRYIIFDAPLGRLHKQTGEYIDTLIHIEVPLDILLCRRVLRDFDDNLKTKDDFLEEISFYLNHSRSLFFDHDLKQNATVVIDGLLDPEMQLRIIKNYLNGEKMTQPKLDTYLSLCTEVYDISKPKPPEDAFAFYRDYVMKTKGPILEPMCGTGRFLLPLLEEGFDVQGFDASEHMLEPLYAKASAKSLKPTVWKGYVEELKRPEKYNLIFIPSGSFCLMIDPAAVKSALKTFYDHLTDDGVLLFECETIKAVPQTGTWRGSVWYKPDGKMIMLSQLALFEDNVCNSIGKYELVYNNSVIHTEIEELKVRIYDPNELLEILKSCGFQNIRIIKAFDSTAIPDENDEAIVYECRK